MSSIAIWYTPTMGSSKAELPIDLHLNLWKVPGKHRTYRRFLDIGIKLLNTSSIDTINIFVPFQFTSNDLSDLGQKLATDGTLICSIFNENYKITSDPQSKIASVTDSQNNPLFGVYQLSRDDFKFENRFGGTIIQISCPQRDESTYLRVRLDGAYCESLITLKSPSNSLFQSAFSKLEITDFRVNHVRDLDRSLLERIDGEGKLKIAKAHFFYMISSNEDLLHFHAPYVSCRCLEQNKWLAYIGQNEIQDDEKILAYHWKLGSAEDVSVLIKSRFESNNWLTISIYLIIIGALSVGFNVLASTIYSALTK